MSKQSQNISVIGDGGWGTTLAIHLAKQKYPVLMWGPFPKYVQRVQKNRYNSKFLPGIRIPSGVTVIDDLKNAIDQSEVIVLAVPSKFNESVLNKIKKTNIDYSQKIFVSVTKGIDTSRHLLMSQIINEILGVVKLAVLSGPTIAVEVAKGIPSSAVVASENALIAKKIQEIFNSNKFRIYRNTDVIGVELGGSIKNIIAIASGVCDGLSLGSNTKAAIVTRGLAEMARMGKALGGHPKTFSGLSGLGDLVTTCFSPQSRNRTVGEKIGKGKSIKDILASMEMVAEGVETSKAAFEISQKLNISMPITTEVYNIIYKRKNPSQAVSDLMSRKIKPE